MIFYFQSTFLSYSISFQHDEVIILLLLQNLKVKMNLMTKKILRLKQNQRLKQNLRLKQNQKLRQNQRQRQKQKQRLRVNQMQNHQLKANMPLVIPQEENFMPWTALTW